MIAPALRYGAVEAGGTKFVCLLGSAPDDITASVRIPTRDPAATLADMLAFFADGPAPAAVGIASFGPLELRRGHPRYGFITASPKLGWRDVDLVGAVRGALDVPVELNTDVAGAALGEGRWGAARGLDTFVYMTVGTGIGAAAVIDGRLPGGLGHAEMGHIAVPRQPGDDFAGLCPFHGDCLEGMASGPAVAARFGRPAERLDGEDLRRALVWEAGYLAEAVRCLVYTHAPQRVVIGGGLGGMPGLLELVRVRLGEVLAGYGSQPEHGGPDFVVAPGLGGMAGPAGALLLAEQALDVRRA